MCRASCGRPRHYQAATPLHRDGELCSSDAALIGVPIYCAGKIVDKGASGRTLLCWPSTATQAAGYGTGR